MSVYVNNLIYHFSYDSTLMLCTVRLVIIFMRFIGKEITEGSIPVKCLHELILNNLEQNKYIAPKFEIYS